MRHDDPFHLLRLDPFPTAEKEIIQAPEESEPSIDDLAAIAGGKPPFVVGQWQQLTVAPVARGHTRRPQPDLAGNDFHLPPRQRRAHIRRAVGLFGADGGSKFGQAIAAVGAYPLPPRPLGQLDRDRRAAKQHRLEGERSTVIQQAPQLSRHQRSVGAALQHLRQRLFIAHRQPRAGQQPAPHNPLSGDMKQRQRQQPVIFCGKRHQRQHAGGAGQMGAGIMHCRLRQTGRPRSQRH